MRTQANAAVLLGIGLMAWLDAIVFHQILQWHHLVDARTPDLATNLVADGIFLAVFWVVALVGVVMLWRSPRLRGRALAGGLLLGGALFNVVEVLVDHAALRLHTLHPSGDPRWDAGFVAINVGVGALGWALMRRASQEERADRRALRGAI